MRIALITDGIWPYVLGGMQKHSYYLCKYLAGRKVHIHLFHFNASQLDIDALSVFTEEEKQYITSEIVPFPAPFPLPGNYLINSYRYSKAVYERMKGSLSSYDFIYTKGFTGWHLLNLKRSGKVSCSPVGVNFHGYEMFQRAPGFRSRLQQYLLLRRPVKSISLKADKVFSYGGKITGIIRSLGVPPEKIVEIAAGVENNIIRKEIRKTGELLNFVFLGRYERRKGIEELNAAISALNKRPATRPFVFSFIGPLPDRLKLKHTNVVYHGEVRDKAKLQSLLLEADILVCPSWSEGMPNVLMEAMAAGLAVMATDTGASGLLVREDTGWLLRDPQPASILLGLQAALAASPEETDRKKRNALARIGDFTWDKLVKDLLAALA